jgi:hypothetical protein
VPRPGRRPRYGSFLISGGLTGLLASVVLLLIFGPADGGRDRTELSLLLTVFLVGTGLLVGGALAVLSESRTRTARRARRNAGGAPQSP